VLFFHDVVQLLMAHHHRLNHGKLIERVVILLEHGHALARGEAHRSGGGVNFPGNDLQEGGFAGTVSTYDAVAVAGSEFEVDIFKEHTLTVAERKIGYINHGCKGTN